MWNPFKKTESAPSIETGDLLEDQIVVKTEPALDPETGCWTKVTTETIEGNNHVYESWVNSKDQRLYKKSSYYDSTYNKETDSKSKVFKK